LRQHANPVFSVRSAFNSPQWRRLVNACQYSDPIRTSSGNGFNQL
jgi:hypothetical protein